jgi:restriction system protein
MAGFGMHDCLIFLPETINIEHMSEELMRFAQLVLFVWPVLILASTLVNFRRNLRWRTRLKRARRAALTIWLVLLPVWVLAWFGPQPAPGILPEPANSLLFTGGLIGLLSVEVAPWFKRLNLRFWITSAQRIRQIHAVDQLNALHPTEFEKLVQAIYRELGYSARHNGQAGDHGVDLDVRTPTGERWVVQCKRWRGSVGEATVRELFGTLLHEGADRAVLVTSADITPPAEAWARGKPIDLVDGPALLRMIERAQKQSRPNLARRLSNWFAARFGPAQLPVPTCPHCRVHMVRHPRLPGNRHRTAYRCSNYPNCRVVITR